MSQVQSLHGLWLVVQSLSPHGPKSDDIVDLPALSLIPTGLFILTSHTSLRFPELCFNIWLQVSSSVPIWFQMKALRRQLQEFLICMHSKLSLLVSGVTTFPWDGFQVGPVIHWLFPQSLLHLYHYASDRQGWILGWGFCGQVGNSSFHWKSCLV